MTVRPGVRLVVLAAVAGAVLVILAFLAGIVLLPPPAEPNPPEGISFTSDRSLYLMGETAALSLTNEGLVTFVYNGMTVQRFLNEEWVVVECHLISGALRYLRPGERQDFAWTVETANPVACGNLPPVEEGSYRGVARITTICGGTQVAPSSASSSMPRSSSLALPESRLESVRLYMGALTETCPIRKR